MSDKILTGRFVLIVEDEMILSLALEQSMFDLGCETVGIAATVDQALELIDSNTFDAATVDVNLNGVESFPVADALVQRGVPFVFMTGYARSRLEGRYSSQPLLRKPFKEADLEAVMTAMISA